MAAYSLSPDRSMGVSRRQKRGWASRGEAHVVFLSVGTRLRRFAHSPFRGGARQPGRNALSPVAWSFTTVTDAP